MIAQKIKSLKT